MTSDEPELDLNLPLVTDTEPVDQPQLIDRPRRVIRPPVRFGFDD